MVLGRLRGLIAPPPKHRVKLPLACAQCGSMLASRRWRHRYCSQAYWCRCRLVGTARVAAEIHRATNAERIGNCIAQAKRGRALDAIVQDRAADTARRGYFAHKCLTGVTDTNRAEVFGFEHEWWRGTERFWIMDNI